MRRARRTHRVHFRLKLQKVIHEPLAYETSPQRVNEPAPDIALDVQRPVLPCC